MPVMRAQRKGFCQLQMSRYGRGEQTITDSTAGVNGSVAGENAAGMDETDVTEENADGMAEAVKKLQQKKTVRQRRGRRQHGSGIHQRPAGKTYRKTTVYICRYF